jgi:hypothetical protein
VDGDNMLGSANRPQTAIVSQIDQIFHLGKSST